MILRTDGSVKRILCILLVLSTIWGCSSYQKETAKETLAFSVLPISSSLLGLPIQIVAFDSVLLVNDYYGDTLVHCLSLRTGGEITKFGVRGSGPNEVMPPLHLLKTPDSLFVLSRPQWILYTVSGTPRVHLEKKMRLPAAVSLLFSLGDSSYLASGMFPDKRFYIFDSAGKEKSRFGNYPNFWSHENDLPIEVKRMFHQVRGYGFSIKNGFALADSHVLSLYRHTSSGYVLSKEVLLAPYEYDFNVNGIESITKLKPSFATGVIDLAVSDEFIYVLFDSNIKDTSSKSKNEIWRYDWDGNLLNKYVPNVDISLITVHPDGTLIGLTDEEESKIAFVKF